MNGRAARPAMVDLLVHHGAVIPMDAARSVLYDGALAIDQGRIVGIGPTQQLVERYIAPPGGTIDARGQAVLPGLIDTHHHFLQNFLKGSRDDLSFMEWIEQVSSPLIGMVVRDYLEGNHELQYHASRLGCAEAALSGITCIVNMEWATDPTLADLYDEAGIRVVHTLTMTDLDQWDSPGMLLGMDRVMDLAGRWITRCRAAQEGRVTFRYGPACENSASSGLLREVRRLADRDGVGIHIHIAESRFGWDNIRTLHGKTPVRYLADLGLLGPDVLGAHCIWLSDEDIQILRETGTSVSYNPECHMKLALGIAPVTKMLQAGVPVSLGTDTCAVNDDMDLFEAMRVGAFLQKVTAMDPAVVPAYQALEMATIGGARALGMAGEIGSLEVGKKADLILVDLSGVHMRPINHLVNNLVYCASAAHDVHTVIVGGKRVVENHQLLPWDEQKVIAEAEALVHRRFAQAGLPVPHDYRQCAGRPSAGAAAGHHWPLHR